MVIDVAHGGLEIRGPNSFGQEGKYFWKIVPPQGSRYGPCIC